MRTWMLAVGLALSSTVAWAQEALPTGDALMSAVDANLTFETRSSRIRMTVVNPRRTREFELVSYAQGPEVAAIAYLAPARDKGTKMLRKGDELWMYLPSVERTQKISGHMLRQGMMGSDMSYEDLLGANSWRGAYTATVLGTETYEGRAVFAVEMVAKDDSIAYPRRLAYVDQETLIPLKQDLFAVSGMLMKTWEMRDPTTFPNGRQFPMKMVIVDRLKEGTSTVIQLEDVVFGLELSEEVFTMRWLERK